MRFRIIFFCYYLFILLIIARLWYWQFVQYDFLTARAEEQRVSSREVPTSRGSILFADNDVLVSSQPIYLVFAQPKLIKDKVDVSNTLSKIFWQDNYLSALKPEETSEQIEVKKKELEKKILDKLSTDLFWVSLGERVTTDTKAKIEKANIHGIGFDLSMTRFYPESSSAAHLLGFVGSNDYGFDTGYFGLEGYYDGELRGKSGLMTQEKDALGLPILIGKFFQRRPEPGKTLVLNIDRTVQYMLEEKLKKGFEKYGAKGASAIIMDPKTGNILGMASYPSYDPGRAFEFPKEYYKNPIIADGYEPGSTFKVLVMAAGINENVVEADTRCNICSGPLPVSGYLIRTWNHKYEDNITMKNVIVHSDNTGMVYVAKKMGLDKFYSYLKNFGFGSLTGIDLQDEYSPDLRPINDWKEIDLATASFGQGISVTALQITRAVAAIANNGKMMEPHVVKAVKEGNKMIEIKPRMISQPISSESAKIVTEMMVSAVEEGEAKFFKPKGYKVAGKTGTAQIPIAGHYDANKTIASFVGFAPASDPKFVMLVRYQEPSSSIYGAETAAPTFFEIAKELFTYYGIPPTE